MRKEFDNRVKRIKAYKGSDEYKAVQEAMANPDKSIKRYNFWMTNQLKTDINELAKSLHSNAKELVLSFFSDNLFHIKSNEVDRQSTSYKTVNSYSTNIVQAGTIISFWGESAIPLKKQMLDTEHPSFKIYEKAFTLLDELSLEVEATKDFFYSRTPFIAKSRELNSFVKKNFCYEEDKDETRICLSFGANVKAALDEYARVARVDLIDVLLYSLQQISVMKDMSLYKFMSVAKNKTLNSQIAGSFKALQEDSKEFNHQIHELNILKQDNEIDITSIQILIARTENSIRFFRSFNQSIRGIVKTQEQKNEAQK
jgi:hypothetical protein